MEDMVSRALKNRQAVLEKLGLEETPKGVTPITEDQRKKMKEVLGNTFKDILKIL